jgi:hypothetical protein
LKKKDLPPAMLNRLLRLAAFQNPEFHKAQAMRLSRYDKPRVIACGAEFVQHIGVPRGCLTETLALFEAQKIRPEVRDERYAGTPIEAEFQGRLRPFQEEAVAKIIAHDEGILCAPTAFGKAAVAAWLIAKRKVNTLGRGPPAAVARSVAGASWNVSGSARQIDRAYRWRQN